MSESGLICDLVETTGFEDTKERYLPGERRVEIRTRYGCLDIPLHGPEPSLGDRVTVTVAFR